MQPQETCVYSQSELEQVQSNDQCMMYFAVLPQVTHKCSSSDEVTVLSIIPWSFTTQALFEHPSHLMEWSLWAYFIQIASFQGIHGLGKNHHTGWTTLVDAPLCELFNLLKIFIYLSLFVYLFIIIVIIIIIFFFFFWRMK